MEPQMALMAQVMFAAQEGNAKGMQAALLKVFTSPVEQTKEKITMMGIELLINFIVEDLARSIVKKDAELLGLCVHVKPEQLAFKLGYVRGFTETLDNSLSAASGTIFPKTKKSLNMAKNFYFESIALQLIRT